MILYHKDHLWIVLSAFMKRMLKYTKENYIFASKFFEQQECSTRVMSVCTGMANVAFPIVVTEALLDRASHTASSYLPSRTSWVPQVE